MVYRNLAQGTRTYTSMRFSEACTCIYIAKMELAAAHPDNPFFKCVVAEVYIGLSDEEVHRGITLCSRSYL